MKQQERRRARTARKKTGGRGKHLSGTPQAREDDGTRTRRNGTGRRWASHLHRRRELRVAGEEEGFGGFLRVFP